MAQIATDIFNRANQSPIAGNWFSVPPVGSITGVVQISSMAATEGGSTNFALAYWNANAFPNDQYSEMSFSAFGSNSFDGPAVRSTSGGNCYSAVYNNASTDLFIVKIAAGVASTLAGPVSVTFHLGDKLRLEVIGTSLNAKISGVSQLSTTDSSFVSGAAGIFFSGNGTVAGSSQYWAGGDFSLGTPKSTFFIIT